jgi:hypothetical protein
LNTESVPTYPVEVNVTVSIDDKLLKRAREVARRRGVSLNHLIRGFLERLTSDSDPNAIVDDLERLWAEDEGDSGGWTFNRDELHDRSLLR